MNNIYPGTTPYDLQRTFNPIYNPAPTKTKLQDNLIKVAELYEAGILDEDTLTMLIKKALTKK